MPFPTTEQGLHDAGYRYENTRNCEACGQEIQFWRTPKDKRIPLNPDLTAHFSTCPDAERFRRR